MTNTNTAKGFTDFIGSEANKRKKIKQIIERQFEFYGFEVAETPIIESREFVRGENEKDDAVRDIFTLEDRGKRELALRYEFTFQLKRISKNQKLPFKRYQIGYNFRDEPIRKGRTRQFVQCDGDVIGASIKDEAECLVIAKNVFEELKMPVKIYINNRKLINEILVAEDIREMDREQVIRELDKLDKLSKKEVADNLKKFGAEKLINIFDKNEKYFEKYSFYSEIRELKKFCKFYGVEVEFRPFLARGFSYYNGSVFEVWSDKLGVSLCGGGSYVFNGIQSTGISFGLEPLSLLSEIKGEVIEYEVISLGEDETAIRVCENLRNKGKNVVLIMDKTVSKAMDYANSKEISKVIFVGSEEVKAKKFKIKDMKTGKEKLVSEKDLLK